jgi:hypothetical protein
VPERASLLRCRDPLCRCQAHDYSQHVTLPLLLRGKPPFKGGKPCFECIKAVLNDAKALADIAHFVSQLGDPGAKKVEGGGGRCAHRLC